MDFLSYDFKADQRYNGALFDEDGGFDDQEEESKGKKLGKARFKEDDDNIDILKNIRKLN